MFEFSLPSGRKVVMKPLTFIDRQHVVRTYKSQKDEEVGYLPDELMGATALLSIDGMDVTTDLLSDTIDRFANWTLKDVQFYMEVFMSINNLDDKMRQQAVDQAKKLMGSLGTTPIKEEQKSKVKITGSSLI